MSRYVICLEDGFGREVGRRIVTANTLPLALVVSGDILQGTASELGAVSASVELLGEYEDDRTRLEQEVEELRVRLCNLATDPADRLTILAGVASGFGCDLAPRFGGGVAIPYPPEGPGLPEGNITCVCGAVTHWQGDPAETCLRCGRSLGEQQAYACLLDDSAGLREAAAEKAAGPQGVSCGFVEAPYDPREHDELGRGLGEIDGGDEPSTGLED
jgi:hypothetical protein